MGYDILWGETLPCMPQVLQRTLGACLKEPADISQIIHWVKQDAVILSYVMNACYQDAKANSSPVETLDQYLQHKGIDDFRAQLLQFATRQISLRFTETDWQQFKQQWTRSVYSARIAKSLAILISYERPDDCYQAALLQDVGQLIQNNRYHDIYQSVLQAAHDDRGLIQLERERLADDHCNLAGQSLDENAWPVEISDAIRFHHEPLDDIRDAQTIVKIVNIASLLSADLPKESSAVFDVVATILGIQSPLLQELLVQLNNEVTQLMTDLQLAPMQEETSELHTDWQQELKSQQQLAQCIADHMRYQEIVNQLLAVNNETQLQQQWLQGLCDLYQCNKGLLFVLQSEHNCLECIPPDEQQVRFSIAAEAGRSLVSDCYCKATRLSYVADQPTEHHLSVVDRQILRYLGSESVRYIPLLIQGICIAVAVMPVEHRVSSRPVQASLAELAEESNQLSSFASSLSAKIPIIRQRLANTTQHRQILQQQFQQRIREALHEINNPLTIVSNYLHTIRFKRPEDEEVQEDVEKITQELQRASTLLEKLKTPVEQASDEKEPREDLVQIVNITTDLIERSLLSNRDITLQVDCDTALSGAQIPQLPLQQILTNLLKNAAEALPPGGKIRIGVKSVCSGEIKNCAMLEVSDDGPGLPEKVKKNLFQQVASSKPGHAGLGLQIVKQLVDELQGMVFCRSSSAGTHFQIILPLN